jgi:hypothetical protein
MDTRTYDWQDWLNNQSARFNNRTDQDILRMAMFTNALHGSDNIWDHSIQPGPRVTYWNGLDSEQRYRANSKDPVQRERLAQWGWLDRKIEYELNSWGFRSTGCREVEDIIGPSLVTLGCSFTFGTGLPYESTWPSLVSKQLGLDLINLGTPGHGLDLNSHWLLTQGHTIKDPRAVAVLIPPPGRITWVEEINDRLIGNTFSMTHLQNPSIIANLELNAFLNYAKNMATIKLWAQSRNVPVYVFSAFAGNPSTFGLARDLCHNGEHWHRLGCEQIVQRIKNS